MKTRHFINGELRAVISITVKYRHRVGDFDAVILVEEFSGKAGLQGPQYC